MTVPTPVPAFRVTVRGRFGELPEESRAALRSAADAYETAFTEQGTFSPDATLSVFSFRVQIPAGPDDDEDDALLRAMEILEGHGHPHEILRTAVTDLRAVKIRRRRARRGPAAG
ncbi:hypothetical protein GCM10009678_75360 [Actinomadura kijaniata]|uniref:Uncharacterized protein n=1 Tax=Actinomadura namibiensis TaxID=182080 RepID=A0A7W3LYL7_ACTNM|nr:DUF6204 family protein [Actinomadura namibiensis]MBA8956627.1 hypothetical protein [Actinomadura namibiensis]